MSDLLRNEHGDLRSTGYYQTAKIQCHIWLSSAFAAQSLYLRNGLTVERNGACFFQHNHNPDLAVEMVLAGKVNKSLVQQLEQHGGRAIGLCGLDGGMIEAKQLDERLGYVGEITRVDPQPVLDVLEKGYIPVVSTVARGQNGETFNINADTAAARIAAALKAECLISMTDIAGVLRDKDDPRSIIPYIGVSEAPQLMREGVISGGMIPKIECCIEAIRRGVKKVFVLDGTVPHAILIEILTNEGLGTMFR